MNSATKVTLTQAGYVGINTTSPTSQLHSETSLSGPVSFGARAAIYGNNTSTDVTYANSVGVGGRTLTSGGAAIYGDASTGAGYAGYFVGRGYFSGNVGIGKSTPSVNLDVTGSVIITGSLTVSGSSTFTNIGPAIFSGSITSTQGFTGSFSGTAQTASFITGSIFTNANPALSASYAVTASYALNAGGGSAITVQDEGSNLTTALTSLNFTGAGVAATNSSGAVTVTIAGGGGAAFPYTGSAQITGSLGITGSLSTSGSNANINGVTIAGGSNNIIIGSTAYNDPDGTSGIGSYTLSIGKINSNIASLPQIWSPETVTISNATNTRILRLDSIKYSAFFIEYVIDNTASAMRGGTLKGVFLSNMSKIEWSEENVLSIGDTSTMVFTVVDNGAGALDVKLNNTSGATIYCDFTSRLILRKV